MNKRYPFDEIDGKIRDEYLRTSQVFDERNELRIRINKTINFLKRLRQTFNKNDEMYELLSVAILNLQGLDDISEIE